MINRYRALLQERPDGTFALFFNTFAGGALHSAPVTLLLCFLYIYCMAITFTLFFQTESTLDEGDLLRHRISPLLCNLHPTADSNGNFQSVGAGYRRGSAASAPPQPCECDRNVHDPTTWRDVCVLPQIKI